MIIICIRSSHADVIAADYFPLESGTNWTALKNGTTTITTSVLAVTVNVNGAFTKVTRNSENFSQYFTNDSNGIRLHRQDDGGNVIVYTPPVKFSNPVTDVGQMVTTNGNVTFTLPGTGVFQLSYSVSSEIAAIETVIVPLGQYSTAKLILKVRIFGSILGTAFDETEVDTAWLTRGIGAVRQSNLFDGVADTFELTAVFPAVTGSLQVTLSPTTVTDAGAAWQLVSTANGFDSGLQRSAEVLQDVPVGIYTLGFNDLSGWIKPENQSITISAGAQTTASGVYTELTGSVLVTITPEEAVDTGGQWRITNVSTGFDSDFQDSGTHLANVPIGNYTLEFLDVTGWITPANQSIVINSMSHSMVTGDYIRKTGSIMVRITTQEAIVSGAQWRIRNSDASFVSRLQHSGALLELVPTGDYSVIFVDTHDWLPPNDEEVTVIENSTTTLARAYTQNAAEEYAIRLYNGWNLVSSPVTTSATDTFVNIF